MPRHAGSGLAAAAGIVVAIGLAVSAAGAQEGADPPSAAKPAEPVRTWTVNCSGAAGQADLACTLSQTLAVKDSGQRVLSAVIARREGKVVMNLALPHGLNLPKGVEVWVDEAARKTYPIVTADQRGSYAVVDLDGATVEAMKKGTTLRVAVTAFNGSPIVLELSLTGFTAGFSRL